MWHPNRKRKRTKKPRPGSQQRVVTLRALRARRGYALKRQKRKGTNLNGWCYWEGQIVLLEKLIASVAQGNDKLKNAGPRTPDVRES